MLADLGSVQIDYACFGNPANPALLLIMGLGTQRTAWPEVWIDAFVARGFYVVTFDNRDVGLSTRFDHAEVVTPIRVLTARMLGRVPKLAYQLSDMADDAARLLDYLQISEAQVFGVSMGGMMAQWLALQRPDLVRSLTLAMTSSGYPWLPTPELAVIRFMSQRSKQNDTEAAVQYLIDLYTLIGSPAYPIAPTLRRQWAQAQVARSTAGSGVMRQFAAICADGARWSRLGELAMPVQVIHGDADRLIPIAHGRDLASRIKQSHFEAIPGMGHDLPLPLADYFADLLTKQP
jgi:pimeloyl-ACP methyl ester carboxylesterase